MIFTTTALPGVFVVDLDPHTDERGFFARSWCARESEARGLNPHLVQCSISYNRHRGTLRGMHYQIPPHAEAKLVRCTRGAIYDVALDLRRTSPTFCQWFALELSADNRRLLYIPEGCAHGFQTLTDHAEVFYQISEFYHPDCAGGVRWDNQTFGIQWPPGERLLSARDRTYPDFLP